VTPPSITPSHTALWGRSVRFRAGYVQEATESARFKAHSGSLELNIGDAHLVHRAHRHLRGCVPLRRLDSTQGHRSLHRELSTALREEGGGLDPARTGTTDRCGVYMYSHFMINFCE
jgi:hypothetical protein